MVTSVPASGNGFEVSPIDKALNNQPQSLIRHEVNEDDDKGSIVNEQ